MASGDRMRYRWVILILFVGSQIVLSIAGFGWGPLAPFLKKWMSLNSTQIGTISSTFFFAASLSAFPAGMVFDRYGVKSGFLSWLGLTSIPLLLLSFFQDRYQLLLPMVAIAGLGYGMGNPVASKGLFIWFDQRTRGTAFGLRQSAVTIGGAVAGIFLVYLSQRNGPFMAIRTASLMIMVMMIPVFFFYHNPDGASPSLASLDKRSIGLRIRGLIANRSFLIISAIAGMLGFTQAVIMTFFLLYANERLNYSLLISGSLLSLVMISGAIGRIFWGVVSDRLFNGRRKPGMILISILAVLSVSALAFWVRTWPHWLFLSVVIGIGLSSVGWNGITFVLVSEISSVDATATAVGLASTVSWAGLVLGPIIFGGLVDHSGYFYAWISVALLCLCCLFVCCLIPVSGLRKEL